MTPPEDYQTAQAFQDWIDQHNLQPSDDYDLKSAYLAGLTPDERGHLPDTYKLPNHITYSDESVYSTFPNAPTPGKWMPIGGDKWAFQASLQNIRNAGGPQKLQNYFDKYEPNSVLIFPKR